MRELTSSELMHAQGGSMSPLDCIASCAEICVTSDGRNLVQTAEQLIPGLLLYSVVTTFVIIAWSCCARR